MKKPKIEEVYAEAEQLAKATGRKHGMKESESNDLRDDIISLMVQVNNVVVAEMKGNLLVDINKVLEKQGYKKDKD